MPSSAPNFAALPPTPPVPYQKSIESITPRFVSYTRYHRFMAEYTAESLWTRDDPPFHDQRYSRRHLLRFDGGLEVPGSSSPHVVRLPSSDPAALDPEEAFTKNEACKGERQPSREEISALRHTAHDMPRTRSVSSPTRCAAKSSVNRSSSPR